MNFLLPEVTAFWDVMPSSLAEEQWHFRGTHYHHLQVEESIVCTGDVVDTGT
jgi:hypothetical protein